jgi:hypothetical protein
MSADEIAREVDMHGKITVTVQRGHRVMEEGSKENGGLPRNGHYAPDTNISCREVVKDNRVSHAVR